MRVREGDLVLDRQGRYILVTDAPLEGPYETVDKAAWERDGQMVVTSSMPEETIFVGHYVAELLGDHPHRLGGTVVSDFSEVVSILK
jgi:hypothetical protein